MVKKMLILGATLLLASGLAWRVQTLGRES